jgi:hypothetical protein
MGLRRGGREEENENKKQVGSHRPVPHDFSGQRSSYCMSQTMTSLRDLEGVPRSSSLSASPPSLLCIRDVNTTHQNIEILVKGYSPFGWPQQRNGFLQSPTDEYSVA